MMYTSIGCSLSSQHEHQADSNVYATVKDIVAATSTQLMYGHVDEVNPAVAPADSNEYATVKDIVAAPSTSTQLTHGRVEEVSPAVALPFSSYPIPTSQPSTGVFPAQLASQSLYSIAEDPGLPAAPPTATTQLAPMSLYSIAEDTDIPAAMPSAIPTNKAVLLHTERSSSLSMQKKPREHFAEPCASSPPRSVKVGHCCIVIISRGLTCSDLSASACNP